MISKINLDLLSKSPAILYEKKRNGNYQDKNYLNFQKSINSLKNKNVMYKICS